MLIRRLMARAASSVVGHVIATLVVASLPTALLMLAKVHAQGMLTASRALFTIAVAALGGVAFGVLS